MLINLFVPRLLQRTWSNHRASGLPLADLVLNSHWKDGPATQAEGPFMISVTQYTTNHIGDIPDIWRASESLGDQLAKIDGAVGVMTYIQLGRRRVGSISIWANDRGLAKFIGLPDHVDIMNKYRPRGLPIRSAKWWTDEYRIGAALTQGLKMLDKYQERRITLPKTNLRT
jgi:hypothetical protein